MKNRWLKTLGATMLLIIFSLATLMIEKHVLSLIFMEDEITFSASIVIGALTCPLILYAIFGSVFFFVFDRRPKCDKVVILYLSSIMFASFIISLPVSLYVDYKLKNDGYLTCDKISWMSPTTYVKNLSLCE